MTTTVIGEPWPPSFSSGRALQEPALAIWAGEEGNRVTAQEALLDRAACNGVAVRGACDAPMGARLIVPLQLSLDRHGETARSTTGQHTGKTDPGLTARP